VSQTRDPTPNKPKVSGQIPKPTFRDSTTWSKHENFAKSKL